MNFSRSGTLGGAQTLQAVQYRVSIGRGAPIDPNVWKIGKLYLNYNASVGEKRPNGYSRRPRTVVEYRGWRQG
ncbi:MAG: hypothetical protein L0387_41040 [Acidobacteria bacterium]|nr:hypothetical protein [Acidobacteriota bacterium]MCI0627974.1 hypothetical protein [Acidobacteriota bacterium]MCI0719876.1 hypothetical protein [Acidobacteriota bacterium]